MFDDSKVIRAGKKFLSDAIGEYENYGSICWNAYYDKDRVSPSVLSQLRLTDCYKAVYFEFDFSGRKEYLEKRNKLDTMINFLKEYAIELDNLYDQVEVLTKWRKKECQPTTLDVKTAELRGK